MRGLIAGFVGLSLAAGPVAGAALAQEAGQDAELARVESLIGAGRYDEARAGIRRWWADAGSGRSVPAPARVHALMLRARLATDPADAERDYLAVALGHPTAPAAPRALLALGQALFAAGSIDRATAYLRRLVDDYPTNPERAVGLLWLARARTAAGDPAGACTAARRGIDAVQASAVEPAATALLRLEAEQACGLAGVEVADAPPREPRPTPADAPPAGTVSDPAAASDGRYAVQTGAFRNRDGAVTLADRLRRAGYSPRLVFVPANRLLRVRIGRFEDRAGADDLMRRLLAAGFPAVVVRDADQESTPR